MPERDPTNHAVVRSHVLSSNINGERERPVRLDARVAAGRPTQLSNRDWGRADEATSDPRTLRLRYACPCSAPRHVERHRPLELRFLCSSNNR